MAERRLGRGLEALLSEIPAAPVVTPPAPDLAEPAVASSTPAGPTPVQGKSPTLSPAATRLDMVRTESAAVTQDIAQQTFKKQDQPVTAPLSSPPQDSPATRNAVRYLPTAKIHPNPYQPRKEFDPALIAGLAVSIREHGVLQPVLVREIHGRLELVAGERRFRAAQEAKLESIPALLVKASDQDMVEMALIENIQRQDLNPIEKAVAFNELVERFGLTQEEVGARVGMDRSSVANLIRLLELPQSIRDRVSRGTLSMGHARALAGVIDEATMRRLSERVEREGLSVRRLENIISRISTKPRRLKPGSSSAVRMFEEKLRERLQTKVSIAYGRKRGVISIEFYDNSDFERILGILGI